jgi:catechol 2,3-dioxygenase-like lactoylglutathione lyase family enzyme
MSEASNVFARADRLGYVELNVGDLDKSLAFWTNVAQLEVSDRQGDRVFLRGGMQHHWIVLQPAQDAPSMARLGIEVASRPELDEIERRLRSAGVEIEAGDGLRSDYVDRYVRFNDPAGNPIELYHDMVTMATPPQPTNVDIWDIQHVVIGQKELLAAESFYTDLLGMRISDRIDRGVTFMHFRNGWHHGIGIGMMGGPALQHICFQPADLDNTMRVRARVMAAKLPITRDLLKHGPSGSVGFYFQGPDTVVEYSFGARHFAEDEAFKPRRLPMNRDTVDVYQTGLGDNEMDIVQQLKQ